MGHAAAGMSREEANVIVEKAVEMYEPFMADKPIGKPLSEAYDLVTLKPKAERIDIYDRVKEQVSEWGLNFR